MQYKLDCHLACCYTIKLIGSFIFHLYGVDVWLSGSLFTIQKSNDDLQSNKVKFHPKMIILILHFLTLILFLLLNTKERYTEEWKKPLISTVFFVRTISVNSSFSQHSSKYLVLCSTEVRIMWVNGWGIPLRAIQKQSLSITLPKFIIYSQ